MRNLCHSRKRDTSKHLKYGAEWFKKVILNNYGITININDVGYETVLLEHVEIDTDIIPEITLQSLPDPLLAHTFLYVQSNNDKWLCIIVTDRKNDLILYETWFKNYQRIK